MFNKRQRFSIRKLSVGVASVLVGLMSISAMAPVSAQEAAAEAEIAPATEEAGDVVGESEEVYLPSGASTDPDNNDQSGKDQDSKPVDQKDDELPIAQRYNTLIPDSLYIYGEKLSYTPEEQNKIIEAFMETNPQLKTTLDHFEIKGVHIDIYFIDGSYSQFSVFGMRKEPNLPVLTEVEDVNHLTDEERERVALAVMNANYSLTNQRFGFVEVDIYGNAALRDIKDEWREFVIESKYTIVPKGTKVETIADKTTPVKPEPVKVDNLEELTDEEREAIIAAVKKANPVLPKDTEIFIDYNGDVILIYSDGTEDVFLAADVLETKQEEATETTVAETTVEEVVTEAPAPAPVAEKAELPNTGTASSIVSLGAATTSLLLGLGVLKRKED